MPTKMHSDIRPKFAPLNLKTISAAVISAMLFANANAAGLGKLTVLSALGQPLHAEIELNSVTKEEAGSLAPKLASVEAFRQANIDLNPALFSLRFAVEQRGGRQFIRVTSAQPINEPFVDMLLELGGANGRLIREYTFLLDPADLRSTQSPQVAAPIVLPPAVLARRAPEAVPAEPASQPVQAEKPAPAEPAPVQATKPSAINSAQQVPSARPAKRGTPLQAATVGKGSADSAEYKVKSGDSLSRIAAQTKPEGVSLDQMLVALYRSNPDAFVDNNMNRLRAGQILSVPDANAVSGINNGEARGVIVAQAADFNTYRNKLAGQVATAAPKKADESVQSATGKITSKVEEKPTAANESRDKLKLSKAGAATEKSAGIAAGAEESIAKDKAIADANARVKDLEKNVTDLQKILEIKNKDLADQQKKADAAKAAATPAVSAAVPAPAAPAANTTTASPAGPAAAPAAANQAPVPAPTVAAPQAAKPKVKVATPPPPEPSFADELMNSTFFLPGVGVLLAALGGIGMFAARRKKQGRQFEDSILTDSSLKTNSLFGSTGGQSVDTNNSVFNSNFAPSVSQLDSNEVDPVAEADVYIAYGRDAQAEEILKEALRTQPDRNAVRVKLLEIYANRKDMRSFETLASELYGMTKGEGDDWAQAAALGLSIDPNNPLYGSGKNTEDGLTKAPTLMAPTQPLDEPDLDALLAVTESDPVLESPTIIENSSYFANTVMATEVPVVIPEPVAAEPDMDIDPIEPKEKRNDLDFDLDGMGLDMAVPNTIPRPAPTEPTLDIGEINFDFLDDKSATAEPESISPSPEIETEKVHDEPTPAISAEMSAVDDFLSAHTATPDETELPSIPESTPAFNSPETKSDAAKAEAFEFDLSGITLELNPAEVKSGLIEESYGAHDTGADEYSGNAEMATKLDLAVAYQEIGDKEGARELLDEVLKGGSDEQAEKAKSLLAKLS